jgi:two-component system, OmpR family, KDP operon response regulator KdpE
MARRPDAPAPGGNTADTTSVLVIEDDASVVGILATALGAAGYTVVVTTTARAGLQAIETTPADLVILDLGLPDMDGLEVCGRIRSRSTSPVIVLTADVDTDRKVAALELGADDYVTKPFAMPELLARIRVAERHRRTEDVPPGAPGARLGSLCLDTVAHSVTVDGRVVRVTPMEFDLLDLLIRKPGALLSHSTILDAVWGPDEGSMEALRVHIANLRRKIGPDAGVEIQTEPGIGYRLVVDHAAP